MFFIVLATVLLTIGAQKLVKFIINSINEEVAVRLMIICETVFHEECFAMCMNKLGEEFFIVNLCESKKYIIFNNETIRNMPKDTVKNMEYIRNLPLVDKL